LRRLRTDRLDLYLLHRLRSDEDSEELVGGLSELVRQGKILAFGFCNAEPRPLILAATLAAERGAPSAAFQGEFSLAVRAAETDIAPVCLRAGLAFMAYSPFAGGHLLREKPAAGRFREADPGLLKRHREKLAEAAARFRTSPARAALSWVLSRPWVATAVFAASTAEQLRQAAEGARSIPGLAGFLDAEPIPALSFER
jgi:aryl-alcohol dehydrogenase-like predicted oxidoreductase